MYQQGVTTGSMNHRSKGRKFMANYKTGSERYNDRVDKMMADCRRIERERLERGEMPNPSLTDPETALKYGWVMVGREVKRA
jgi:hypothetical protein